MIKKLLFIVLSISSSISLAQKETVTEVSDAEMAKGDVPFAVIENVPVYPGCNGSDNVELKKCMSDNISAFVNKHFNMKMIERLDLPPKIYRTAVQFKIDKSGNVVDVRARADHPEIEKEAVRVVSKLPEMLPGKQKGEAVGVLYSLPIVFKVESPTRVDKKRKTKS